MNGAEAIVKCLREEGADTIFGYSGAAIDPFWQAVGKSDIRPVLVRTEQNAAHAASGYARVKDKVGVCTVTSGPGALNLLTGIATAFSDSIPLICITGQVDSSLIGSDVFQEADITGAAESFVKYSYLVKKVRDIPRVMKEAFYIANSGRKGPVLIDVPQDILEADIKDFEYPKEDPQLRTYKPTIKGHAVQIKKVARELEKARAPLICCGGGIILSGAKELFKKFIEKHRLPVVSTMMGLGVLPSDHPMYFGMVGNNGSKRANRAMRECDLLIMFGARVADRAVADPEMTMEGKILVHIDVDPAEIGKNVGSTIPIVGDAYHILEDFMELDFFGEHEAYLASLNNYEDVKSSKDFNKYVEPAQFVHDLSSAMDYDAVYVADVGQNQILSCRNCVIKNGSFLTSGGMGTMGYSIPAALGAYLGADNKQVVAVCGDGAFQMSMMELSLINAEKLPIKIVVMKNDTLGMVREHQYYAYKGNYQMVDLKCQPDLNKIAEAYGIDYFYMEDMQDMEKTIREFLGDKNGALMEVRIDPDGRVR